MARAIRSNPRLDLIVLATCVVLALAARALPNTMRDPVATGMRRTFLAPLVLLQERSEKSRRSLLLADERTAIKDSVSMAAMQAAALEGENDRLRKLMGLGARLRFGFVPAEALHGRGIRDETTVILSAGSRAGVSRLSPVIAPEGLVGVVDQVDPTMSHAMLWTHPDFRVSAMSPDGTAFGIAQAHLTGATGGYLIELRGVPFRATLKPGAMIVSSGWGGVWPRGIPVGTVLQEIKTTEGWARTYLLRPAVNPADVYSVMILRRDRLTKGLEGVWESVAQADAAAQRIVVAGDSAAKAAALAEAAARRAVLDSTARANGVLPLGVTDSARRADSVRGAAVRAEQAAAAAGRPIVRDTANRVRRDTTARDTARRDTVPLGPRVPR
ncbi:MAG TPA: rod shape-determining protein MreC [Gemmatimonadaceae bacterium]|nr:rod shape-determining protein MreC [Gemmatimonadaceae bacterium]